MLTPPEPAPVIDALVGLVVVSRRLDELVASGADVDLVASNPELLDAIVGLHSLHEMVRRALKIVCDDGTDPVPPPPGVSWSRDVLR